MKTNFQQYNSKSDEDLIELSMSNSVDVSMARAVLDYRKYIALKKQNNLSFSLSLIVAFFALIQVYIATLEFQRSKETVQIDKPTGTSSPTLAITITNTPISIPSLTQHPSHLPTLPSISTAILQQDFTITATDGGEIINYIYLTAGTSVNILSIDSNPKVCNAKVNVILKTQEGSFNITDIVPLSAFGEFC